MAPRANWKGYLRLSLVSCPVALYPATSEREKVSFHQLHKQTGNRIKYLKVDAETGDAVDPGDIVKGYEVSKGHYVEVTADELAAVSIESGRTIDIDEFVPREEINDLYNVRPYFVAPSDKIGFEAFVTIREAIEATGKVALGRLVLTTREHVIALEPCGKGLVGTLLRYPYEVRDPAEYFDEIPDLKINKEMLDLAKHIVESKAGHFKPEKFEDRYEDALKDLIKRKAAGETIEAPKEEEPSNVINLMDALRRSIAAAKGGKAATEEDDGGASKPKKHAAKKPAAKKPAAKKHAAQPASKKAAASKARKAG